MSLRFVNLGPLLRLNLPGLICLLQFGYFLTFLIKNLNINESNAALQNYGAISKQNKATQNCSFLSLGAGEKFSCSHVTLQTEEVSRSFLRVVWQTWLSFENKIKKLT